MGRIRMHVALDYSAYSLETFILDNVQPGSTIATDGWEGYSFIDSAHGSHEITNQSRSNDYENLYGVHLVTSLVKRLIWVVSRIFRTFVFSSLSTRWFGTLREPGAR